MKANLIRLKLCQSIISEHFGLIVQSVASALLSHGRCSLGQLIQLSKQSLINVKSCLFILLQHGLISFVENVEGTRLVVYYEAKVDQILERNQIPIYMATISHLLGSDALAVFNEICKHGKLSWSQLESLVGEDKKSAFIQLVQGQFISKYNIEEGLTAMDLVMKKEAEAIERKGSILTPNELTKLKKELALKRQYEEDAKTGMKRKWAMEFDSSLDISDFDKDYYGIHYQRFKTFYRDSEFVSLAEKKINASGALVLKAMLKAGFDDGNRLGITVMRLSSFMDPNVALEVEGNSTNTLVDYLEALSNDDVVFVSKCDEKGGGQYVVNVPLIISNLQQRMIESVIQERFGILGCRIWRLLLAKKALDEKQVAKLAMISSKAGRECLYQMLKQGFVFMQDVPKTADHSASRTYFLWTVQVNKTKENILLSLQKMILNLKTRVKSEQEARKLLIEKTKRLDVVSGAAKLSEADMLGLTQLNSILEKLKTVELRLERMMMILLF